MLPRASLYGHDDESPRAEADGAVCRDLAVLGEQLQKRRLSLFHFRVPFLILSIGSKPVIPALTEGALQPMQQKNLTILFQHLGMKLLYTLHLVGNAQLLILALPHLMEGEKMHLPNPYFCQL